MKWTRHNYEHLMEQPTAFYALVIILAMVGDIVAITLCGLDLCHRSYSSQLLANASEHHSGSLSLFMIATLALAMLGVHAVMFTCSNNVMLRHALPREQSRLHLEPASLFTPCH